MGNSTLAITNGEPTRIATVKSYTVLLTGSLRLTPRCWISAVLSSRAPTASTPKVSPATRRNSNEPGPAGTSRVAVRAT